MRALAACLSIAAPAVTPSLCSPVCSASSLYPCAPALAQSDFSPSSRTCRRRSSEMALSQQRGGGRLGNVMCVIFPRVQTSGLLEAAAAAVAKEGGKSRVVGADTAPAVRSGTLGVPMRRIICWKTLCCCASLHSASACPLRFASHSCCLRLWAASVAPQRLRARCVKLLMWCFLFLLSVVALFCSRP